MISSILLCGAIVLGVQAPEGQTSNAAEREAYEAVAAAAGKDAGAQVRLALWCEAHGLTAERLEHLSRAVRLQPANVLARGLLGLVRYQGKWERPDDVGERVRNDSDRQALVREYLKRRAATPDTPQAQMKLAAWCADNRLKEQAIAHYNAVIRLDPSVDAAWRHLGYKKQGYRWIRPDEVAAAKQEATRQKQADRHWRTKLEKLRNDLHSKDAAKRARAEQALAEVTDPRAVPAIWALFVTGSVRHQMAAIQMFGQIDGPSASNALAVLAVFHPGPEVRARATEALRYRDPRDVVGRLIGMVHKPFKYQVRPVRGPGAPGELYVEGERFNFQRFYENQTFSLMLSMGMGRLFTPDVPFDPFSIRNLVMAMPSWRTGPVANNGFAMNVPQYTASFQAPIAPDSAAQAARAIAGNPQNAQAIVNQLVSNPNNRIIPPGFWFPLTNPADAIPVHLVRLSTTMSPSIAPPSAATIAGMQAFARQVQAQANNANSPMGKAIQLGKTESSPASQQYGPGLAMMLEAQQMAAQRDIQIGLELQRIRQSNLNLQQRLAMDVQFIEWTNENIKQTNARVLPVLTAITGLELGTEHEKWKSWWMDQLDLSQGVSRPEAKPTFREAVTDATGSMSAASSPMPERPTGYTEAVPVPTTSLAVRACLAAGTSVHTIDGPKPIEALEVGDRVLSQHPSTGSLEYQPVLAAHRNKPAPTLRIAVGVESIDATELQRFWKAGKGWTMARDLKAGDRLRRLGGAVPVASIAKVRTQPVYNVDVAGNTDLLVGADGLLVHDFGFVRAVPEPFDHQPERTAPSASGKP